MLDGRRRPLGWLFYWAAMVIAVLGIGSQSLGAPVPPQSGAATTTVSDTVYLADGTAASGDLIITWPSFVTADGTAVAAGATSVKLGTNGALNIALVPNAGASPAGVYYTVVYQLGPGQVKTEYWMVPTTSPARLATVRATPGSGVAAQPVSMQYVNSALATKADDSSVVHLNGSETIGGAKTFASAPNVPAPSGTGSVVNKAYVDQAVANVGAGSYLATAGGTMTGPITLPGNPTAPLQAAPKQYVDAGFSGKADLIAGLVPASELGAGTATAGACLLGSGTAAATWGACGGGGGAGNVSTTPAASQNVVQPAGTQFSTNNLANARYVTGSWNWLQTPSDSLGTPGSNTIHLSPCPLGVDTSNNVNAQYAVYIAGTGTAEAAPVTGGSCAPGSGSGTITVTTAYAHTAGYTVGSASSGIQEAINDSGTQRGTIYLLPATSSTPNYRVYSTVFLNARKALLTGYGALVQCFTRSACMVNGNYLGTSGYHSTIEGIEFMPGLNIDGVQIASVSQTSGTYTITTATNHPFVVGDYVTLFYSNANATQQGKFKVLSVPAANQFTYNLGGSATVAAATSYGWAAIEAAAVEDTADHVTVRDIKLAAGTSQYFHWGIVIGNDQSFRLDGMAVDGGGVLRCTANFCGALVYARGDQGMAPVVTIEHLEASMQCGGNGVRYAAGNTLHVMNSVVQGFNQYGIYYAGGLQDLMVGGTYQESSGACHNPAYPGTVAAQAGIITNSDLTYLGSDPIGGLFPTFVASNPGSTVMSYYVKIISSAQGNLGTYYIGKCSTAGTGTCTLYWPEPLLDGLGTVTYDVLGVANVTVWPTGTGNFLLHNGAGVSGSCNSAGICTFVDDLTAPTNYTMLPGAGGPARFGFWPGSVVLGGAASLHIPNCGLGGTGIVTTSVLPKVYCDHGVAGSAASAGSLYWATAQEGDSVGSNNPAVGATLKQYGPYNAPPSNGLAGLFGFLNPQGAAAQTDVITINYANPFLALATPGYRPAANANDTAIGNDQPGNANSSSAQLSFRAPVAISEYIGSVFDNSSYKERLTASAKTFNVPVTINGNLTVTGTCTGCGGTGGGGGSGTVNSGGANQIAMYGANGTAVSGDSSLTDSGSTLNYSGSGGIAANSGTFSGNLSVGGQLIVTGPWLVNSPIPTSGMGAAASGTSSLGISNDGNFYISANAGTPSQVQTAATMGTTLAGYVPNTTTVNGHPLSGNVTVSASEILTGILPHAQLPALVSEDIPNNAANTTGTAANLSGTPTLPNGTMAATQTAGDNSTKLATTAFVAGGFAAVSPVASLAANDYVKGAGGSSVTDSGVLAGPYPVPWITAVRSGGNAAFAANVVKMWGVVLSYPLLTSTVIYNVTTADAGANSYDIGIACAQPTCGSNSAGQIILDVGATAASTFAGTTGGKTLSWAQGQRTLQPGKYYIVFTTNCTSSCATLASGGSSADITFQNATTAGTTSGGTLANFTAPSDSWSWGANIPALVVK